MKINLLKLMIIAAMIISPMGYINAQPPLKPLNKMVVEKEHKTESHSKPKQATEHDQEKHDEGHSHTVSIDELLMGNENFQKDVRKNQNFEHQREEQAKGQKPNYIIVTCSDSRVAPELLFDSGLGELFVVRTAGNVVDSVCLGSIEYAAEHLHSQYVIVLGHTSCGAVTAAMQGETESAYINSIIKYIAPAVKTAKNKKGTKDKMLMNAIEENVYNQVKNIRKSPIIKELEKEGHITIVSAIYDIASGEVKVLK